MEVSFDPAKDAANPNKHGISLARAADFDVDSAIFDRDDSQDYGEERWSAIGWLDGYLHTLTLSFLEDDSFRAISLRQATPDERKRYEREF